MNLPKNYARIAEIAEALSTVRAPALSSYELGKMLYLNKTFVGKKSAKKEFESILEMMLALHLLTPSKIADSYMIFGKSSALPNEIICSLDPFSYISHLSAMEFHGLTDRFSKILYMTRPPSLLWKEYAKEKMSKDLNGQVDDYLSLGLPSLIKHKYTEIGRTLIDFHERSQLGAFRIIPNSPLRVATVGRVFLDMLREPNRCGGIQHVLDVYKQEARRFLKLIIDEFERHGKPIDKVRAGFILSEVCGLENSIFHDWENFAQRGGSRKLDPEEEFSNRYSERWMLSINVPSISLNKGEE